MASRQGGVHISYLIVAMVISLGLIVATVLVSSDRQSEQEAREKAERTLAAKEQMIKKLTTENGSLRELLIGDAQADPDFDRMKQLVSDVGGQLAKELGTKDALEYRCFNDIFPDIYALVKQVKADFSRQESQAEANLESFEKAVEEKSELETLLNGKLSETRAEVDSLQARIEEINKNAREKAEQLRNQIEENSEQYAAELAAKENEAWIFKHKFRQAQERIDHLESEIRKEKHFAQVDPDGEVLRVADELGLAWIDLGRSERLRRGIVFDVFQYGKGGKRIRKGRVEVMKIDGDMSEVRILNQWDSFNPISAGDLVASPFYNKDDMPVFVIAGEKLSDRRLSLEEMEKRIKRFGGAIEAEVNVKTTYVVAVEGYEQTAAYKDARQLGVTVLRERELLDFIGL